MKRSVKLAVGIMALALVLTACGSERSQVPVQGNLLFAESFDASGTWEEGIFPASSENTPDSSLAVQDGRYTITYHAGRGASFIWGVAGADHPQARDVIIEVDAEQISAHKNNLYGVMCRLSETASGTRGYAFLISGDGYYGIAELENNNLTFLKEWHQSGALNEGQASNTLEAICVGDYLALYANGEFLGEVTGAEYGTEGAIGLIGGSSANNAIEVTFDDLSVYAGTIE